MNNLFYIVRQTLFAAAFITGCCFVCGCENKMKDIEELSGNKIMVEEAKGIESYMSQDGLMKAKLTAPEMLRVLADTIYVEFPNTLHVDFFSDSPKIDSWLSSKYAKYFETLDKVYLRDSVIIINVRGDTLKCIDLWWDQNAKIFYSDTLAIFHGKDRDVQGGKGLLATQDMTSVTFKEPIATFNVSDSGTLK